MTGTFFTQFTGIGSKIELQLNLPFCLLFISELQYTWILRFLWSFNINNFVGSTL